MEVRDRLLDCGDTPEDVEHRVSSFGASYCWIQNLVNRQELGSMRHHGEVRSVDDDMTTREGVGKVKSQYKKCNLCGIFNVDGAGLFFPLLPRGADVDPSEGRPSV